MPAKFASSYIPTGGAQVSRTVDALSWVFNSRPQAMTVYLKFIELGTATTANTRVLQIGANTLATSRLVVLAPAGKYQVQLFNASGTSVTSTATVAPAVGNVVELRITVTASGVIQLHQTINGGTEVSATASGGLTLPQVWQDATLWLGRASNGGTGFAAFLAVHIERGIHDLATMRQLAGVNKK